ncbi:hypothetical protein POVWA2_055550 [Plasmodium ovale wallikeri]|uniref:MINDY deubiquitinase domain-containing protein n=2 Tax=Plasmodium ovale TaxID=36330 RepID=A0A1A8ZUZ5_PLAOA|nr:hypothetical protein POVWA1_056180 [Plasmodium ovale wallikeri]SBT48231.1 hypothetical protein POVWA2_055550 [Plasmodium ovale wallikeri]SBT82355.1 conserved protein, unknown function [Plasmodium ovale]
MSSLIKLHYDENNDEEENMIIRFADYETFKSYVLKKYDKTYELGNYEKENINYYSVKWINFINRKVPILLQNKSGPCPLLCITNILLLRNQLQIDKKIKKISQSILENKIMNILLESNKKNVTDHNSSCNYRKNIIECVDILPQLKYGLDVNCKFTDIHSFEYTKGLCIFDMLNIPLYHGWVISSEDLIFYSYLKDYSYNVIINKIIRYNEYYERKRRKNAEESSNEKAATVYQIENIKTERVENAPGKTKRKGEREGVRTGERKGCTSKSIPIFPDDLDKNSESDYKLKLFQNGHDVNSTHSDDDNDLSKKKINNTFARNSQKMEGNIGKRKTHSNTNNFKSSNSLNFDKKNKNKYDIEVVDSLDGFFTKDNKDSKSDPFLSKKNNHYKNKKKMYSEENVLITPKFPEDCTIPISVNDTTAPLAYSSELNVEEEESSKKYSLDEDVLRNSELFMESNKIESLSSDLNGDNITENITDNNTENSENFIMKNYNTDINLTPYEIHEALIISEFLETYKTQLTLVGLKLLQENLNPNQLVAFFRNNHFNTLFKYENKLFLLAADISFLHLSCTWELFDNVDNDTSYYDNNFQCLSNQKNHQKNFNHSIILLNNYENNIAKNNIHCLRSNSSLSNSKKKKKKCTFM